MFANIVPKKQSNIRIRPGGGGGGGTQQMLG